ncbi:hypothetical protein SEPCBS57363_002962 [Sporothrix epigloea]|uniref:Extracellular serine-rich protein n=1 Tax=Sporothrix epigloea TaxID=1892477 RepID=A0ABP0DIZ9_9PEZI
MSLQLVIFASLVGMAMSMTTASAASDVWESAGKTAYAVSTTIPTTMVLASGAASTSLIENLSTRTSSSLIVPTTVSTDTSSASSTASSPAPPAKTIAIAVGESGLSFTPNTVEAAVGDHLEFSFYPRNHSVTLGTWDHACVPVPADGFFSGFLVTFRVTVDTSDPLVFYCSADRNCQEGMFGVVNPANSNETNRTARDVGKTLAAYARMARNASSNVSPRAVFGGTLDFNGTTIHPTTNGTICGRNSVNITSASAWCIPNIPDISSDSVKLGRSLWVLTAAAAALFLL